MSTTTDTGRARRLHQRERHASMRGFTLLEVMIALGILAVTLVGLIGRTARNVRLTHEMGMMDVAVDLTRGKMYDLEAELLKEGFSETNQEFDGDFADEGWPDIEWKAVVEKVELPNLAAMDALQGEGEGDDGEARGPGNALGDLVGGMMPGGGPGGPGGGLGGGIDASMGASIISSQYDLFRQVLEVSIRKVTLEVTYDIGNEEETIVVACYFTDPYGMSRAIAGLGALAGSEDSGTSGGTIGGTQGGSSGRPPLTQPRGGEKQ